MRFGIDRTTGSMFKYPYQFWAAVAAVIPQCHDGQFGWFRQNHKSQNVCLLLLNCSMSGTKSGPHSLVMRDHTHHHHRRRCRRRNVDRFQETRDSFERLLAFAVHKTMMAFLQQIIIIVMKKMTLELRYAGNMSMISNSFLHILVRDFRDIKPCSMCLLLAICK